jgi:hypothetical protein
MCKGQKSCCFGHRLIPILTSNCLQSLILQDKMSVSKEVSEYSHSSRRVKTAQRDGTLEKEHLL